MNTQIFQIIIRTGQIFFLGLLLLLLRCNSDTTFKGQVEKNINTYEKSANEIVTRFDTLTKIKQWQDTTFHSLTLYSSQLISSANIIQRTDLFLEKTKALTSKNLAQFIFLNSDTSVYYNTYNFETSMTKNYRHFLCFTPRHGMIKFDMINHGYKILKTKSITKDWTYVILEVGFD